MGGRRLRIVHHTAYQYSEPVEVSFNEVRMTPLDSEGQHLLGHELSVHPGASIQTYTDYWGAMVEAFEVHTPHRILEIVATSTVDTPPTPTEPVAGSWSDIRDPSVRDRCAEYLSFSDYVDHADADEHRRSLVQRVGDLANPRQAALEAMRSIRQQMTYLESPVSTPRRPRLGRPDTAFVRISPTYCCRFFGLSEFRHATSAATCTRKRKLLETQWWVSPTRGSSIGTDNGMRSTRRTIARSALRT